MYHPTTRVLTILELLQANARLSGSELAARLEVDTRTVRRYIVMLQEMGIPVEAEPGRHGGYMLRPGFKLPPLILSNDEITVLTLGLLNVRSLGVADAAPVVESALAKIGRILPKEVARRIGALQASVDVAGETSETAVESAVLAGISLAAVRQQSMRIWYESKEGTTERILDPYGIVRVLEKWYTVGFCHLRGDIRVFRIDRIRRCETTEQTFTPPAGFDCLAYINHSIAAIPDRWNIEVLLAMSLEEARLKIPPSLAILEDSPDGLIFRAALSDLDWVARFLINLGCPFRIRQPHELRQALAKIAQEIERVLETGDISEQ